MDTFLWVEQYRPKNVESCVLPKDLKDTFSEFVKQGEIPNLTLSGSAGVGKTTIAKAMLDELGATYMMINGSGSRVLTYLEPRLKTLRPQFH